MIISIFDGVWRMGEGTLTEIVVSISVEVTAPVPALPVDVELVVTRVKLLYPISQQ